MSNPLGVCFLYIMDTFCKYYFRHIPEFDILARVRLVRFLHVSELKVKSLRLAHLTRPSQILHQRHKLMMVPSVIVQLCKHKLWSKRKWENVSLLISELCMCCLFKAWKRYKILPWEYRLVQMSGRVLTQTARPRLNVPHNWFIYLCFKHN